MAEKGFGNGKNSYQTPIGQQEFQSKFEGVYGQVVVAKKDHPKLKYFKREYVGGGVVRRFVSDFGHQTVDEPATVVTDRYTINEERGVHFHASNRTGRWHRRGNRKVWVSFLTPRERSTDGCIRMANADVRDMGRRYIKMRVVRDGKVIEPGTPVAIYATPEVMARHAQ
jgi:hypothetical protein